MKYALLAIAALTSLCAASGKAPTSDEAVRPERWLRIGETRMADYRLVQAKMAADPDSEEVPRLAAQLEIEKFLYRRDGADARVSGEPKIAPLLRKQARYWEIRARKRNAEFKKDHAGGRGDRKAVAAAEADVQRWTGEMSMIVPEMQKLESEMGDPPGARTAR